MGMASLQPPNQQLMEIKIMEVLLVAAMATLKLRISDPRDSRDFKQVLPKEEEMLKKKEVARQTDTQKKKKVTVQQEVEDVDIKKMKVTEIRHPDGKEAQMAAISINCQMSKTQCQQEKEQQGLIVVKIGKLIETELEQTTDSLETINSASHKPDQRVAMAIGDDKVSNHRSTQGFDPFNYN